MTDLILICLAILPFLFIVLGSISVFYNSQLTVTETIGEFGIGIDNTITTDGLNATETYTASTAVPVTKKACFQKALSTGTGTIDLTALPGKTADETITFAGLKMVAYKFRNNAAGAMTLTFGASNPHLIFGAAGIVVLPPGAEIMGRPLATGLTIDSSHCEIDISGTGSQVLDVELVAG